MGRILRLIKHRWYDEVDTRRAVPPEVMERLKQRVVASEQRHSGEIRICIEAGLPLSYLRRFAPIQKTLRDRATAVFGKLRVWDTEHNNGVLIYLLLAERAIEIVADRGLARYTHPADWERIIARMTPSLREGKFEESLTIALAETTALLAAHFPLTESQTRQNELPDAPVIL